MTIIESSVFTGLDFNKARPGARARFGQELKTALADQAYNWRSITGLSVPNAPGVAVAPPHVHDGVHGAVIPISLFGDSNFVDLAPADIAVTADWAKLFYSSFFVPAGITSVRVFIAATRQAIDDIRVSTYDESLALNAGRSMPTGFVEVDDDSMRVPDADFLPGGVVLAYRDVPLTPGEFNVVLLEAWDGFYNRRDTNRPLIDGRLYFGCRGFPMWTSPNPVAPYTPSTVNDPGVVVPGGTQHLGAHAFTSVDDSMTDDDRGIGVYPCHALTLNNGLNLEMAIGQPVGGLTSMEHEGHGHGDAGSTASPLSTGALIDHALASFFFGVGRGPSWDAAGAQGHASVDEVGRNWQGRIFAPTLKSTASTGVDYTLGVSAFRMPDTTSANAVDVTSKVASSVLAYNDTGGPATVKLLVRDWGGGGASGVEQSVTIPSGGVSHVVTTGLRTDTGSEELKELRIRAQWATAKASSLFLYSAALGLIK